MKTGQEKNNKSLKKRNTFEKSKNFFETLLITRITTIKMQLVLFESAAPSD